MSKTDNKNILINFRGGMGDFIIYTPVLRNIANDGKYNLFFIGDKDVQELVNGSIYFRQSIYIDYKRNNFYKFITLLKLFLKFRSFKIHICITPISSYGKFSYLVTKLSKAKIRIGFEHE